MSRIAFRLITNPTALLIAITVLCLFLPSCSTESPNCRWVVC